MRSLTGNCPSRPPSERPSVDRCSASYDTPLPMPRAWSSLRKCLRSIDIRASGSSTLNMFHDWPSPCIGAGGSTQPVASGKRAK